MPLVYPDFKKASYRNLVVCKELLQILPTTEARKKTHILHKVYYLSGYIIEFCYKYALFSSLNASKYENLDNFKDDNFNKKWKHHDFIKLKNVCNDNKVSFSSDIPYIGNNIINRNVKKLIDSWDVQIRYSINLSKDVINLNQNDVKELVTLCEEILNKITTKFS